MTTGFTANTHLGTLRAAVTVLEPLEVKEETLRSWLLSNAGYGAPPGVLPACQGMPMFVVKP